MAVNNMRKDQCLKKKNVICQIKCITKKRKFVFVFYSFVFSCFSLLYHCNTFNISFSPYIKALF
jgi:hypothetical protein